MAGKSEKKRLLLAVVGVGRGNSSRCQAILDELAGDSMELAIAAQGRAYDCFKDRYEVHNLAKVDFGETGKYSPWTLLRANLTLPLRFWTNVRAFGRLMDQWRPDVVVADSDFYCLWPARRRGIRLLAINSCVPTLAKLRSILPRPRGLFFSRHCIEGVDAWLMNRFPDQVIAPVLNPASGVAPKFRQVPPIVRADFLGDPPPEKRSGVVVMLGGSGIGTADLDLRFLGEDCTVIGPFLSGKAKGRLVPFAPRPADYLRGARAAIIQGGFSSLSEVVALRLPCVVAPISGHAEQFTNAWEIEHLGLGVRSRDGRLQDACEELERRRAEIEECYRRAPPPVDGARQAAQIIREALRG